MFINLMMMVNNLWWHMLVGEQQDGGQVHTTTKCVLVCQVISLDCE
jgi:hypothetical protein